MSGFGSIRIGILAGLAATMAIGILATPASAQGLFDSFFGNFRRPAPPPQMRSFSDPFGNAEDEDERPRRGRSGVYATYCVRLCDGRHFPLSRGDASPAQLCQSLCPAAKTKVFSGSGIDHASAPDGTRYADLDNAFLYRDKLVDGCTCNGTNPMGLATLESRSDPTLKPGDIVATTDGLMAYRGQRDGKRHAAFTPIDRSVLSAEWRRKLSTIRVAPVHEEAPDDSMLPKNERAPRGQASR